MLKLTVNGRTVALEEACDLARALNRWGHSGSGFAVAVNGSFVPRSSYESFLLRGGESIEVLVPMQGG